MLFSAGFTHKTSPQNIDLNCVRLAFQVFLEGNEKGAFTFALKPVVSDPIYDRSKCKNILMSKTSSPCVESNFCKHTASSLKTKLKYFTISTKIFGVKDNYFDCSRSQMWPDNLPSDRNFRSSGGRKGNSSFLWQN